jgi:hypothetical protein
MTALGPAVPVGIPDGTEVPWSIEVEVLARKCRLWQGMTAQTGMVCRVRTAAADVAVSVETVAAGVVEAVAVACDVAIVDAGGDARMNVGREKEEGSVRAGSRRVGAFV